MGEFGFGARWAWGRCAVGGSSSGESVAFFDDVTCVGDLEVVAMDAGVSSILTGQDGDQVNVLVGVPDRDPAACPVVTTWSESGLVHHLFGDVGPFIVGQEPVGGSRSD
nr:hypothetical protein [Actinomadura meyerae]